MIGRPDMQSPSPISTATCRRCGTCCRKGGPALHREDKPLVLSGQLPAASLYTIRRGEWVRDNVKDALIQTPNEIIKVKGQKNRWTCAFLDNDYANCSVYDRRPLECRMLQCWHTEPLERTYARGRLSRRDLFHSAQGIWNLITAHQQACDYDDIRKLAESIRTDRSSTALEKLDYILRYDDNTRQVASAKLQAAPELWDLLFGRPVSATLQMFGLKAKKEHGIYHLRPATRYIPQAL